MAFSQKLFLYSCSGYNGLKDSDADASPDALPRQQLKQSSTIRTNDDSPPVEFRGHDTHNTGLLALMLSWSQSLTREKRFGMSNI